MAYGIIYKYVNIANGKVYVGQTQFPERRKRAHQRAIEESTFHSAVRYWGIEKFRYEILEECDSQELLNQKEIFWIRELRASDEDYGYNQNTGGSHPNWTPSAKENARKSSLEVRSRKVRELTDKNYTAGEIGEILCLSQDAVRGIAEENNIDLWEDVWEPVFARTHKDFVPRERQEENVWDFALRDMPKKIRKGTSDMAHLRHLNSAPDRLLVEEYSPKFLPKEEDLCFE